MRLIFEENIENSDFLELILEENEVFCLDEIGIVHDFPEGLINKRNLNVFIRKEGKNAISKRC